MGNRKNTMAGLTKIKTDSISMELINYTKNERKTFNKIIVLQLLIQKIRSITASNYIKQLKLNSSIQTIKRLNTGFFISYHLGLKQF